MYLNPEITPIFPVYSPTPKRKPLFFLAQFALAALAMGSRQKRPLNVATRKTRRRHQSSSSTRRRRIGACGGDGGRPSTSVTDKLEALKNLIPSHNAGGGNNEADQLFQQTADYILLLRTQVSVLQRLVDFYGSSNQNPDVVVVAAAAVQ